jgi:hypothetical protein
MSFFSCVRSQAQVADRLARDHGGTRRLACKHADLADQAAARAIIDALIVHQNIRPAGPEENNLRCRLALTDQNRARVRHPARSQCP